MLNLENAVPPPLKDGDIVGLFRGIEGGPGEYIRYPFIMYRDGADPITIENTDQENDARKNGYDNLAAGQMANRYLVNWFWDLEDMSPKQLSVFAQDEYGVDLPIEAGQGKLFECVCKLSKAAPKNRGSIVLMAHSIKMNYDETLEEIRRMADAKGEGYEIETESWEMEI